jgi:hypothetical protein
MDMLMSMDTGVPAPEPSLAPTQNKDQDTVSPAMEPVEPSRPEPTISPEPTLAPTTTRAPTTNHAPTQI